MSYSNVFRCNKAEKKRNGEMEVTITIRMNMTHHTKEIRRPCTHLGPENLCRILTTSGVIRKEKRSLTESMNKSVYNLPLTLHTFEALHVVITL